MTLTPTSTSECVPRCVRWVRADPVFGVFCNSNIYGAYFDSCINHFLGERIGLAARHSV